MLPLDRHVQICVSDNEGRILYILFSQLLLSFFFGNFLAVRKQRKLSPSPLVHSPSPQPVVLESFIRKSETEPSGEALAGSPVEMRQY